LEFTIIIIAGKSKVSPVNNNADKTVLKYMRLTRRMVSFF